MKTKIKKLKYTKPNVRLVEWNLKEPICNQIITASLCIKVDSSTRVDHFTGQPNGFLEDKWESWPEK